MDDLHATSLDPQAPESSPENGLPSETGGQGRSAAELPDDDARREPQPKATPAHDAEVRAVTSVEFTAKSVSAEHIEIAGQIFNQHWNVATTAGAAEPAPLSTRHFTTRTAQDLEHCEEELVFEDQEILELYESFAESRVLVLTGEPEAGKGSLCLLLGSRLTRTLQLHGMLTCRRLGAGIQIDLEKVADDGAFGHQVVMFEDALAGENSDLKTFCKTVDSLRLTALRERLRKSGTAVLLTASSTSLGNTARRLENLGILRTAAAPTPELLIRALRHFAARLPRDDARQEALAAFITAHAAEVARELKTVPRMYRFVQEYLAEVAAGNLSLRQALGRMDDLSQWLTADLAGDLNAQAAVLAIVAGSALPPAAGVPWLAFDELRRGITALLRKEARLPRHQPSSPPELGPAFLDRARAYVATLPSPLPDLVRFRDDRYPERLWQALIGPAREIATRLVPLLHELALDSAPALQAIVAAALGRLGPIGASDLAVPLVEGWTRSNREDLTGSLLEGCANSGDDTYRDVCLAALRGLALEGSAEEAAAAVRSLSSLGLPDPAVPIRELCIVARQLLPIDFDRLREVEAEVTAKEREIRREAAPRQVTAAMQAIHHQGHLLLIAALVPVKRLRLLGAVQYALGGVLFAHGGDPGPVLRELAVRMQAEPAAVAPLLAYLLLHQQGLIDLLDRYKWSTNAGSETTSRFLLAARPEERDPTALRELLERTFSSLDCFPGFFRFLLEQRFFAILKSWSRDGCEVAAMRPTAVRLLSALLASGNADLRRRMERFLATDPDFIARGSRLLALGSDVRDGKGLDDAAPARPRRLPAWMGERAGKDT